MNLREIQEEIGTTPDGVFGPKTAAALAAAKYDVVLDAGHTADRAREYPGDWPAGTWDTTAGRRIARTLGFTVATKNSVEHLLNVNIAVFTAAALQSRGLRVLYFDDPVLPNSEEYRLAAKIANAAVPRVFLSLHANASNGVRRCEANTACGSITFYRAGHEPSARLAAGITPELLRLRAAAEAPSNRADMTAPSTAYHVLNATPAAGASALVEVGFYDCMTDLEFMAGHLPELGRAVAEGVRKFVV